MLAARGAVVIDADQLAREAVAVGAPGFRAVVDRFGPGVVAADGTLDRRALARTVFDDAAALADLNAIVHPPVRAAIADRVADLAGTDDVVVLEIPLLVESGRSYGESAVVVVDCPEDVALRRLVGRGMEEADARRRMAAQLSRADRLAAADVVIDNSGPLEALEPQVEDVWARLIIRPTGDDPTRPDASNRHQYSEERHGVGEGPDLGR
ncbi:MAG TPA: dephospho-CoA kinase [Acidimicrobiales bacterium]|nr:dephospho-CoA kinase [Acidimicrobiales bacterium]